MGSIYDIKFIGKVGDKRFYIENIGKRMNWQNANDYCKKSVFSGVEGKLPSGNEMKYIFENKEKIGDFFLDIPYWTSEKKEPELVFEGDRIYTTKRKSFSFSFKDNSFKYSDCDYDLYFLIIYIV